MSDIDQQFIEYVVKSLVGKPEAVHIDRSVDEKGVLLELTVDPEDLGRVIGKRGATAQSLRTLLRALGTKNDARYNLKIIDNGPLDHGRSSDDSAAPAQADNSQPATDDTSSVNDTATDDNSVAAEPATHPQSAEPTAPTESETPPAPETSAEPKTEPEAEPEASTEEQTSDRLAQARKELADLDDLDV